MKVDLINERVKAARKELGLTQTEFGKLCGGVSKAAVSQWEHGDTKPTLDSLVPLERKKSISSDWILSGRGAMLLGHMSAQLAAPGFKLEGHIQHKSKPDIEAAFEDAAAQLSPEDLSLLEGFTEFLLWRQNKK